MTTPAQVKEALKDYLGNKVIFAQGWSYRGRQWPQNRCRGVVEHHTVGVGDGVLGWCLNKNPGFPHDGRYPFCNEYTRRSGTTVILSALSAWHSGDGGPWPRYGVPRDLGHLYLWGREIESWGREKDFTDEMWDTIHKSDAALADAFGWRGLEFNRLINHKDWTNGGEALGLDYRLPTYGRKSDTLYPTERFRVGARAARVEHNKEEEPEPSLPPLADPYVDLSELVKAAKNNGVAPDVSKVALALSKVGIETHGKDDHWDDGLTESYRNWQRRLGYRGASADGIPGSTSLRALAHKSRMFQVVI